MHRVLGHLKLKLNSRIEGYLSTTHVLSLQGNAEAFTQDTENRGLCRCTLQLWSRKEKELREWYEHVKQTIVI